jgi:hypothetical protein
MSELDWQESRTALSAYWPEVHAVKEGVTWSVYGTPKTSGEGKILLAVDQPTEPMAWKKAYLYMSDMFTEGDYIL